MKFVLHLTFLLPICLLAYAQGLSGQAPRGASGPVRALTFGVPIERNLRSGEVHGYRLTAAAGDLVSGTLELRGLAALVQIVDRANVVIHTAYSFESSEPVSTRIGFVAPAAGTYRLEIKAFDRFDGGPQTAPGEPMPVVGTATGSYALQLTDAPVAVRMRGVEAPVREDYPSARLKRLTQDVQAGRRDALQSFWRDVAGRGPLVEELPGNDQDADVTFLWREIYDTRNVLLIAPTGDYLSHLSGTDVWYKTVRLRRGTRFHYLISPNHRPATQWVTTQLDPLNPRRFPDDPTYRYFSESVLDMPGAPDEQWALRTPVRRGAIEQKTVSSELGKEQEQIWIYTPPGYSPSAGPYPLVILFDGDAQVSNRFMAAPATLDNLINDGRIRPAVVCFETRNRSYPTEQFGDALVKELIPMLRTSYSISANPADVIIGGYSAGGRAAAYIALRHSEVFGNVLSQSGAFRQAPEGDEPNASARAFVEAPRKSIRFYMEVGRYDNVPSAGRPLYELVLDETTLMGNRHLRDVLRAKGYDVTYREVGGGHDYVHWRAMLADGLMTLLKR